MPARHDTERQIMNQHEVDLSEVSETAPFVQDASITTSQAFPSLPADANKALVYVEGQPIRWRPDGATTAPTASVGMVLAVGSTTLFSHGHAALEACRFIETAVGAKMNVVYYQ